MQLTFKIYNDFSPHLISKWQELYKEAGKIYNTSYDWCNVWFRYFGDNRELFLVSGWNGDRLEILAPLYRKGHKLHAIGTDPDFFDKFCILCRNREAAQDFVNFIIENKYEIDFRLVFPDCAFFKYLMRRLDQEFIYKKRIYGYKVKPLICRNEELIASLGRKYKKLKRKEHLAQRDYNDELQYDFFTDKNENYIDEFIYFHQRKWDTFRQKKARDFVRDLYLNNDFVTLSRLHLKNSGKSVAYSFKYQSPDRVLYSNMFSYNEEYSAMSPGLLVTYYDLCSDLVGSVDYIDYGTGSFEYKYYFANKEEIVMNVKADLCWKKHKSVYYFLRQVKNNLTSGVPRQINFKTSPPAKTSNC